MGGGQLAEKLTLLSRAMQVAMLAIAVGGVVTSHLTWVPAAVMSLIVTEIPSLLKRDLSVVLPARLNFLIVLALFLHVWGGFSGFYDNVPGWDHITHALSSALIATLAFIVVLSIDQYFPSIFLPRRFLGLFIAMFTMAIGTLWEFMEFTMDELTGSHMQYSLDDTMLDLFFDGAAGGIVAAVGSHYLSHTTRDELLETMGINRASQKIVKIVEKRKRR